MIDFDEVEERARQAEAGPPGAPSTRMRLAAFLDPAWRQFADEGAGAIRQAARQADALRRRGQDPEAAYQDLPAQFDALMDRFLDQFRELLGWARETGRL
jgi:hypothetical protein